MFFSHTLLSRKGPLGTIWVAAYCHKRLKKDQVTVTDVPSSVDEIMLNEVTIPCRVLGSLLLGIVRIYSKKVDYLYHDCNVILARIKKFSVSRKTNPQGEAMCEQHASITLPERFELDAFDLEVSEDISWRNTIPREETLEETLENERREYYSPNKYHISEPSFQFDIYHSAYATFDDAHLPHKSSSLESNVKMVQCSQLAQEENEGFDMLGIEIPVDVGPQFDKMDNRAEKIIFTEMAQFNTNEQHVFTKGHPAVITPDRTPREYECPSLDVCGRSEEFLDLDPQFDGVDNQVNRIKFPEIPSVDVEHNVFTHEHQISITPNGTQHKPTSTCVAGSTTPRFMAFPTPDQKEKARVSRKRKYDLDEAIVLPNKLLRHSMHDSSSLVAKRRKAPLTAFDVWRADKISRLKQDFMEPSLVGITSKLKTLFYETNTKAQGPACDAVGLSHSAELEFDTPCKPSEQRASFQENSVDETMSVRSVEVPNASISQVTRVEKDVSPFVMLDLVLSKDVIPQEEDNQDLADGWTVRTRTVAKCLQKSLLIEREQKDDEYLSLASLLKGRTRKESARLFYEILVLKTKGFVDVKQENPFDDILVLATPQMENI